MGLFSKVKDILFDVEEVEEETKPEKKEKYKERLKAKDFFSDNKKEEVEYKNIVLEEEIVIPKEEKKEETIEVPERELFKSEPTFPFPVDFDDDLEILPKKKRVTNILDFEKEEKKKEFSYNPIRERKPLSTNSSVRADTKPYSKPFKASPVISPVYGIMGKEQKKETIKNSRSEDLLMEKTDILDLDSVRKKAYGTLEDEIENTLDKPTNKFYQRTEKSKSIDDLLADTYDEKIDLEKELEILEKEKTKNIEVLHKNKKEKNLTDTFTEEEILKEVKKEDNSESDIFNLIDSMYERKDEE